MLKLAVYNITSRLYENTADDTACTPLSPPPPKKRLTEKFVPTCMISIIPNLVINLKIIPVVTMFSFFSGGKLHDNLRTNIIT